MVGNDALECKVLSSTLGVQLKDDVVVAIGGSDDLIGANKTDFYFPGILISATLTVDDNPMVKNGKLVS
jgi:hypothetical protein